MDTMNDSSQEIQFRQYDYPYHHIPFLKNGGGMRVRMLNWGFEYLSCMGRIMELIVMEDPKSVLDVGCGDGVLLASLPRSIKERVGVDINSRAIAFARAFSPDVEFRNQPIEDVDEVFDVVCAVEVLEHIPDRDIDNILRAIATRVAPGGSLLISVPTKNILLNPKHFRHYDLDVLKQQVVPSCTPMVLEHVEYFYVHTFLEKIYKKLTQNAIIYGEIPFLRRFIYGYVEKQARQANDLTGAHLIARFRQVDV